MAGSSTLPHPFTIELSRLDWGDRTFSLGSPDPSSRLMHSLDRFGILHPPWVWPKQSGLCTIVDGFKRLAWARGKGREALECLAFPEGANVEEIMLRRVEQKLFSVPPNAAEKAGIISRLDAFLPPRVIVRDYFPALGIAGRPESIESWCALAEAEDTLLDAAALDLISERSALELTSWEEPARGEALSLLKELRCSSSIQKEILDRVTEVAMSEGASREVILERGELKAVMGKPDWNHRQKTQSVRDVLMRWRFPRLSAREARFQRDLHAASLPGEIRILHPPAFEGENWQLVLAFSNPESLEARLNQAMELFRSVPLRSLMSPQNKGEDASS